MPTVYVDMHTVGDALKHLPCNYEFMRAFVNLSIYLSSQCNWDVQHHIGFVSVSERHGHI